MKHYHFKGEKIDYDISHHPANNLRRPQPVEPSILINLLLLLPVLLPPLLPVYDMAYDKTTY